MENTRTVCRQVADCSLPRSNNHGLRSTSRERSPRKNWEKGVAIKDGYKLWKKCVLLNIKLQQKQTKWKREKLYKLLTSRIQPYNLFYLIVLLILI